MNDNTYCLTGEDRRGRDKMYAAHLSELAVISKGAVLKNGTDKKLLKKLSSAKYQRDFAAKLRKYFSET